MKLINKYVVPILGPLVSVIISFSIGGAFIFLVGKNPFEVYGILFTDTLGNTYGLGQVLFKATPLIFTGLSAAIAFRAGLFNIGAEGQLYIGSLVMAVTGFTFTMLPSFVLVPLCLAAGIFGGAFWGLIPGILKAKLGSHEVINTIMFNFIALALASYLVNNVFIVPATIHTPEISISAQIARLDIFINDFKGSSLNFSFLVALLACCFYYYLLWNTPLGYEITTLGINKYAAEYAKMNVKKLVILSMAVAGGFAGLAGSNFVMGHKHYFELGFSEGAGFIGIAVAIIGKNHPIGIILAAIFFGILEYGGLSINAMVPKELVTILQSIIIFFTIIISKVLQRYQIQFKLQM